MDLKFKDNPQLKQGYLYAVRLLTASKKSESELSKRLLDKGYPHEVIQQVADQLKDQGILSDQKLAHETTQWSIQAKQYGRRRISLELKKKGVVSDEIERALETYPKTLEKEIAFTLAEERWKKLKKVEPQKRKGRLYNFLISRGFDFELVREIVDKMKTKSDENI